MLLRETRRVAEKRNPSRPLGAAILTVPVGGLTDRFGINYAYAGLMVAGFGAGGLIYSLSVEKLVAGAGAGVLALGGALLGAAFVFIGLMPSWPWFIPAVIVLGMGYYTMHGTLADAGDRAGAAGPRRRRIAVRFLLLPGPGDRAAAAGRHPQGSRLLRRLQRRWHRTPRHCADFATALRASESNGRSARPLKAATHAASVATARHRRDLRAIPFDATR